MRTQQGDKTTIETVGELKKFIRELPDEITLDLGFDHPVEVMVMRDDDSGKLTLSIENDIG